MLPLKPIALDAIDRLWPLASRDGMAPRAADAFRIRSKKILLLNNAEPLPQVPFLL